MKIALGYGDRKLELEFPPEQRISVYEPKERSGVKDLRAEIRKALSHPIGSKRLREIAKTAKRAAILVDDITRAVPTKDILLPLVDELLAGRIKQDDVMVIVARGIHRRLRDDEFEAILGPLSGKIRIQNHEPDDKSQLTFLNKTRLGTSVYLNRFFLEADLKILTGDIEFHQFVGYGGGAKSVFPGIADRQSIELSHSRMDLEGTGAGRIEGNPVREEVDEVGRMAGVDFIINVVLNSRREVVEAFAGDMMEAFLSGVRLCDEMYKVEVPRRADIVIASAGGYPRDIDLYQSQKAVESAVRVVKKGGKVILVAECREGHGSELFCKWMEEAESIDDIFPRIKEKFVMGGHKAYQFAREIKWADIYLLSAIESKLIEKFFMHPLSNPDEIAHLIGSEDEVIVLPQATLTLAVLRDNR